MTCKADIRFVDNIAIVDLSGRITVGEGAGLIRNCVMDLVEKGRKKVLLNLADVMYLDSAAGLGELVGCYVTVSNWGGELKLLNPRKTIRELLQITKLDSIFEVYSNEVEALQSFRPQSSRAAG